MLGVPVAAAPPMGRPRRRNEGVFTLVRPRGFVVRETIEVSRHRSALLREIAAETRERAQRLREQSREIRAEHRRRMVGALIALLRPGRDWT